jgi:hypothetical protein
MVNEDQNEEVVEPIINEELKEVFDCFEKDKAHKLDECPI